MTGSDLGRSAVFRKRRMRKAATATRRPSWGHPAPCPDCGALGVLVHVDPVRVLMNLKCRHCRIEWHLGEADVDNPPDAVQRARARALKEEEGAIRDARLAAAKAEADWQSFHEKIVAEGIEGPP
jgi:transcription elongation factor Elf1